MHPFFGYGPRCHIADQILYPSTELLNNDGSIRGLPNPEALRRTAPSVITVESSHDAYFLRLFMLDINGQHFWKVSAAS